jgi:hypothetical protein
MLAAGLSRLTQIEEHARRAVDTVAGGERRANQPKQSSLLLRAIRDGLQDPVGIAARRSFEDAASHLDAVLIAMRLDEFVGRAHSPGNLVFGLWHRSSARSRMLTSPLFPGNSRFRFVSDATTYPTLIDFGSPSNNSRYNLKRCCGNGWRELRLWTGSGFPIVLFTFNQSQWYHIAISVSGSGAGQVKVYVDGVLRLTTDGNPAAERLSIGNNGHSEWLDGNAASVKVYNASLTATEIVQEMNSFAPVRTSGLNNWSPLQTGSSATFDQSGHDDAQHPRLWTTPGKRS